MAETLAQLVRRRLKELGINQAELARRAGFTRGYINNILNEKAANSRGQYVLPPESAEKLAHALEVSIEEVSASIGYINSQRQRFRDSLGDLSENEILLQSGFSLFGGFPSLDEKTQIEFMKEIIIIGESILRNRRQKHEGSDKDKQN